MRSFNIRIGGEAGQGLVSIGNILLEAIAREGWYLFANQDYESRIRGGHNYFQIRLADEPVRAIQHGVDLLVALDKATVNLHWQELTQSGHIIYDPRVVDALPEDMKDSGRLIPISFEKVVEELGQPKVMANAVAAGAIWALLSDDITVLQDILAEMFISKGEAVVEGNRQVAQAGFDIVRNHIGAEVPKPPKPTEKRPRMLLKGNEALPLGALAAGVRFMSAYPMTPSTGVTEFIAGHAEECGVVMEQAEDEISAINMIIGAAYTGVRAMTATSGGGFALMTEALGIAGAAEIPVVIIDAQRPGPSTGLPTRTEQGDLLYAVAGSSGDFPKAVLAPGDPEEAFYLVAHAFNLAEEYQMPVIVMSDQHLADSHVVVDLLDLNRIEHRRGLVAQGDEAGPDYVRYRFTEDGISPRLYPGFGEGLVVSAGDEHDEQGHLIEDAETRTLMMEKRMAKLEKAAREVLEPVLCGVTEDPDFVLIGWGSTKGAIKEAVEILNRDSDRVMGVHLPQVYPLPQNLDKILNLPARKYIIESNYTGQLERLIASEFAWKPDGSVRRYDGRPMDPEYILAKLEGGIRRGK